MITWSYRLNSLDNIYLADYTIRFISTLSSANALSSRRARARNFITFFPSYIYLLHEAKYLREGKRSSIRLFVDLQALHNPPLVFPVIR